MLGTMKGLSLAEQRNINSHRIDPNNGTWNINAPLWLNLTSPQENYGKPGMRGLIAVGGAGVLLILQLFGISDSLFLVPIFMLLLAFGILIGVVGRHAGFAVQLNRWEKKWGKTIRLETRTN